MSALADAKLELQEARAATEAAAQHADDGEAARARLKAARARVADDDAHVDELRKAALTSFAQPKRTTGIAFVAFRTQAERTRFVTAQRQLQRAAADAAHTGAGPSSLFSACDVRSAPEPDGILWENLEVDAETEKRFLLWSYSVTIVLVAGNLALNVWVRIVFLGSYDVQRWLSNSFGVLEEVPLVDPATLASGLSACCTTVANGLSLIIITALN